MSQLPAAVIFDMDGLLLDSEAVMRRCYNRVTVEQGWTLADGVFESLIGLPRNVIDEILEQHVPPSIGAKAFHDAVHVAYDAELADGIPLKAGAIELSRHLASIGVPRAVATSTAEKLALSKLERAGLLPFMEALACGNEVANGKPAPDIFLLAAQKLKVNPVDCVAFEDSPTGVRSALAAGMRVVQVPDLVPPEPGIEAHGVIVAESLAIGASQVGLGLPA